MKYVDVDCIISGDILARPILTLNGVVLLGEGTLLSSDYISKIKLSGTSHVYIYENIYETRSDKNLDFASINGNGLNVVSNIYQKVVNAQSIQIDEVTPIVEDILTFIRSGNAFPTQLMQSIKLKDDYTYTHSLNTCFLSVLLGEYLNLNDEQLIFLGVGALLHDIGKIKIDDYIIKKPSRLTADEYSEIQKHTIYGYKILKGIKNISKESCMIALNHHEKFDGSGYPAGISGDKIDFFSQIVAVADIYDALLNVRSYKKGQKPNEVFEFILSRAGTFFNIKIVQAFRDCILIYPNGIGVKLSDGSLGYVVRQNENFPERPVVQIVSDKNGDFIAPHELDLMKCLNVIVNDIIM